MAATVRDPQYAGMEPWKPFSGSGAADGEGICLGNEKFINFAYWIRGEGYNSYPGRYGITSYAPVFEYVCNGTVYHEQTTLTGTAETGKSVETLRFAEMLSSFAQIPGDVDSTAGRQRAILPAKGEITNAVGK